MQRLQRLFGHAPQFGRLRVQHRAAGFQLGNRQQILNQEGQPIGVLVDDVEETGGRLGIILGPGQQGFGGTFDEGQRRPEFVGDIGDKIAPHLLEPLAVGQIMEHQQGTGAKPIGIAEGNGIDLEGAGIFARGGEYEFLQAAAAVDLLQRLPQRRIPDDLQQGTAEEILSQGELALHRGVGVFDRPLLVQHQHSLHHGVEQGLLPRLLGDQGEMPLGFKLGKTEHALAQLRLQALTPLVQPGTGEAKGHEGDRFDKEGRIHKSCRPSGAGAPLRLFKPVAHTPDGLKVLGRVAQFFPQTAHVGIHRPGVDQTVVFPDIPQQRFTALHPTAPLGERQ